MNLPNTATAPPSGTNALPCLSPPLEPRTPRLLWPSPQSFPWQGSVLYPSLGGFRGLAHMPSWPTTGCSCPEIEESTLSAPGFEHTKIAQESPTPERCHSGSEGCMPLPHQNSSAHPATPPQQGSQPSTPLPLTHSVTSWFSQEAAVPIKHPSSLGPRLGMGLAWPRRVGARPPSPIRVWA